MIHSVESTVTHDIEQPPKTHMVGHVQSEAWHMAIRSVLQDPLYDGVNSSCSYVRPTSGSYDP